MKRRVAVTGIGLVCPLGDSADAVYANAHAGRSAVHRLDDGDPAFAPFAARLIAPLAATTHFDPAPHFDPPRLRMLDRIAQFALVAARQPGSIRRAAASSSAPAWPAR